MTEKYDEIVSLGTQCNPGLSLRELGLKGETYPFDWNVSNEKIIYDVILNGPSKHLSLPSSDVNEEYYCEHLFKMVEKDFPPSHINAYGQYFTHYLKITTDELIKKFERYFERFFSLLESNKCVLFIHSHEEYIYHGKERDDRDILYGYLCSINDLLCEKYPNLRFTILNIDMDNTRENYGNIININLECKLWITDNAESRHIQYYMPYREKVTEIIKNFLDNKC